MAAARSCEGCAAAWMVRYGVLPSNAEGMIEQGLEMKRPSQIYVCAEKEGETVSNVRVGGHAVLLMRGVMEL